jgi:hypothetical protein
MRTVPSIFSTISIEIAFYPKGEAIPSAKAEFFTGDGDEFGRGLDYESLAIFPPASFGPHVAGCFGCFHFSGLHPIRVGDSAFASA